jgi:hypothetical protein
VPRIACLESADGERFIFDIDVTFPLIGWLIHYRGWLEPRLDQKSAVSDISACGTESVLASANRHRSADSV